MNREQLGALILADLEGISGRIEMAYFERLPRMQALPKDAIADVAANTRQALHGFIRYYIEGSLDTATWKNMRDATFERAGELFSHEEILDFAQVARSMATDAIRHMSELHPELSAEERLQVLGAMDGYVHELARQEDRLRGTVSSHHLDTVLRDLETEGVDLA